MSGLEHHLGRQIQESQQFFWHLIRWKIVSEWLPRNQSFQLLDIGAGAGFAGHYLKRDFPNARYTYVEPIASLAAHLGEKFGVENNFVSMKKFEGARFVTLLDVLEHQDNDRDFLRELLDKMEPGARLIITVPAFQFLWSSWDDNLGHRRRYTKGSLINLFQGLPARVLSTTYFFPELLPLALWRKFFGDSNQVGFPSLSAATNFLFFAVSRVFLPLKRFFLFGTSLFLIAEKSNG